MRFCIDPGHGFPDPGALGSHSQEADINLAVALALKDYLVSSGIEVVMTRKTPQRIVTDNYVNDLQARVDIANNAKADYFLSIHCNSHDSGASGTETYCYLRGGQGEQLAKAVQSAAVEYTKGIDRGVKTANFYVLRNTKMPAALIELLFISNPQEEQKLTNPEWQKGMARALAQGICHFVKIPFRPENKKHPIMGQSKATQEQMEKHLHNINPTAPYLAGLYLKIGALEGVCGDMAFAQSIKETGYFRYGGVVRPQDNNYCGLMDSSKNTPYKFATPEQGLIAHIQHLKAYASTEPLSTPLVDPKFHLIKRGSAPNWEDLNGKWAVPGNHYGEDIVRIWKSILETPNDDIPQAPSQPSTQEGLTHEERMTLLTLLEKLITLLREGKDI